MATNVLFAKFPQNLGGGDASGDGPMDILSDAIHFSLHTSTWTPNQSTNEVKADATNELSTAGGYTALGSVLASKTYAATALVTMFDAADVTWTSFTNTFRYGVGWDNTVATPTDPLMFLVDTGGNQNVTGTDLAFNWHATNGIFTITVS